MDKYFEVSFYDSGNIAFPLAREKAVLFDLTVQDMSTTETREIDEKSSKINHDEALLKISQLALSEDCKSFELEKKEVSAMKV